MTEIVKNGSGYDITVNGTAYARIPSLSGATDSFEKIEEGAYRWHRHTDEPTDKMRMELILLGAPTFTMIPAVSYNGNGWGDVPEYVGDRAEDGTPWSFASHRVTIPSCTYSENAHVSIALMAEANDNSACSLYRVEEGEKHVLIFPEEEQPKTLQRHFWGEAFQGTMQPRCDFDAIILARESNGEHHRYNTLLDFAWRYYGHPIKSARSTDEIYNLSIAYARYLLQREKDGFIGFTRGAQWHPHLNSYQKREHNYELSWVGQNASLANAFIYDYIKNNDEENLQIALEVQDLWLEKSATGGKFLPALTNYPGANPNEDMPLESMTKEDLDGFMMGEVHYENALDRLGKPKSRARLYNDACNLGTGAEMYFESYDLLEGIGIRKPEYLDAAIATCDLAVKTQGDDGCFAKLWNHDGEVLARNGTVGCFLILPLLVAYKKTGDQKYIRSATRAFDFYYDELRQNGFTTAGALDTYSIDKESSSPLLRAALALHEITKDASYVAKAEKIAWYLCTWMMHYTVDYPESSLIHRLGYDTFGATSVSTPHQALDQYALRDIISFIRLAELTENVQWKERAIAFWCNTSQGISDGTLFINKRLRPAGSQDEAIFHTRWGRRTSKPFGLSQWLPAWPCAFRLENLRKVDDRSIFDEGLTHIKNAIKK